jgi:hypothetical protein
MEDMASMPIPAATEATPTPRKAATQLQVTAEHLEQATAADLTLLHLLHQEDPMEALQATKW